MKKTNRFSRMVLPLSLSLLVLSISACSDAAGPTPTSPADVHAISPIGAAAAQGDGELTLADMLTYALQDEYLARAEYGRILQDSDGLQPFVNILQAEETHVGMLEPLFEAYRIDAPADGSAAFLVVPGSLAEAYATGVQAEIANIAMYETFLAEPLPADVAVVFRELAAASRSHLAAFDKNLDRVS